MQKQILIQISSLSLQEEAGQTQTNQKVKLNAKKKRFWPEDKVNFPTTVIHNHLILLVQNLQWFLLTFPLFSLQ